MNFYSIRHLTRFRYSQPISESIMETRMHPRSDSNQHCLTFSLSVSPRCRVFSYRDHLGNNVQHFDIPGEHNQLVIVAESVVEQQVARRAHFSRPMPGSALDELVEAGDYWEMLLPSTFAVETPALTSSPKDGRHPPRRSADAGAGAEPAALRLLRIRAPLHARRLAHRRSHRQRQRRLPGLCPHHDRLLRHVRIPARYVSGYLYRSREDHDRSTPDATHAWVDVLLPHLGWVGFDPHQQPGRAPSPHPHRRGPRLRRCAAHARHLPRQDRQRALRGRAGRGQREPPALDRKLPIPEDWSVLVERAQQPPEPAAHPLHRHAADAAAAHSNACFDSGSSSAAPKKRRAARKSCPGAE
jgi:transglutaminase-like putative cysteine protease